MRGPQARAVNLRRVLALSTVCFQVFQGNEKESLQTIPAFFTQTLFGGSTSLDKESHKASPPFSGSDSSTVPVFGVIQG